MPLIRLLLLPLVIVWGALCLLVAIVTLCVGMLWGYVMPSQARKVEAETSIEESFEEDYDPRQVYDFMVKPRAELSPTQKFKRLRMQYSKQMFVPTSPKIRQAWFEAQRRAVQN